MMADKITERFRVTGNGRLYRVEQRTGFRWFGFWYIVDLIRHGTREQAEVEMADIIRRLKDNAGPWEPVKPAPRPLLFSERRELAQEVSIWLSGQPEVADGPLGVITALSVLGALKGIEKGGE